MAESQGLADEDVAVAVVGVVVEVAAAEAGAVDCDLDFVFCWGGQVAEFLVRISIVFLSIYTPSVEYRVVVR